MQKRGYSMVRELLLGDNPFIGVSHLAQDKAMEESREATLERKVKVIEAALKGGATGFAFSTHEANLELLTHLRKYRKDLLQKLNYYILLPYAQFYVRKSNIVGTPALIKSVLLKSMMKNPSAVSRIVASTLTLNPKKFVELFIEAELLPYLDILPKDRVKSVLMHEVLTELLIAFNLADLLECLDKFIRKRLKIAYGLETRNISQLHTWLDGIGYYPEYIMTPINPLGYQMAYSKERAEEAILALNSRSKIIVINILASGAITLDEAIEYLSKFKDMIYAITSASIRPGRIRSNFQKLSVLMK
jgi:hypothetical protein